MLLGQNDTNSPKYVRIHIWHSSHPMLLLGALSKKPKPILIFAITAHMQE